MSDPFLAEIRIFPYTFPPLGWAFCNGQILPLSQNTALFSLLGTFYGGDGKSNFALPDMQGNAPMHWGDGAALTPRFVGETGGESSVQLLEAEIPLHAHNLQAQGTPLGGVTVPTNNSYNRPASGNLYSPSTANVVNMAPGTLAPNGGSLPHNNLMPYLVLNFCIALQGIYPPRG